MSNTKKEVRVRIAPSPTGFLHIGLARTALFNWLYAKQKKGKFILRIEDTDKERSDKKFESDIMEGLRWLGLDWDEGPDVGGDYGPYRQSERTDVYKKYLEQLLGGGQAYWCFCSKDELAAEKKAALNEGVAPKYSGKCSKLSEEEVQEKRKDGAGVIRFRVGGSILKFDDLVRERISFDNGLLGDMVIAKGLEEPLYNFSVVVDDALMEITHVVRGEDHITNTPKQILIQEALGFSRPKYAHLPLILAPGRSKLSKRFGEASLNEYKGRGYLREAVLNFIVLLGWHPTPDGAGQVVSPSDTEGGSRSESEVLSVEEMRKKFSFKKVQKGGAVFDGDKLDWFNGYYTRNSESSELLGLMKDFVPAAWFRKKKFLAGVLEVEKERMKNLSDLKELGGFFFELPDYESEMLVWKESDEKATLRNLEDVLKIIELCEDSEVEEKVMALALERGKGEVLWPLRVALSGQEKSPGPFEIFGVLGREESVRRVRAAIDKLGE